MKGSGRVVTAEKEEAVGQAAGVIGTGHVAAVPVGAGTVGLGTAVTLVMVGVPVGVELTGGANVDVGRGAAVVEGTVTLSAPGTH